MTSWTFLVCVHWRWCRKQHSVVTCTATLHSLFFGQHYSSGKHVTDIIEIETYIMTSTIWLKTIRGKMRMLAAKMKVCPPPPHTHTHTYRQTDRYTCQHHESFNFQVEWSHQSSSLHQKCEQTQYTYRRFFCWELHTRMISKVAQLHYKQDLLLYRVVRNKRNP